MEKILFEAAPEMEGERIDKCIFAYLSTLSRSYIQKIIKDGNVLVNNTAVKQNYKVRVEDKIQFVIPPSVEPDIPSQDIPLDILYEDEHILVVNKPKGMVVHPAAGHYTDTLVNAIMYHCGDHLSGINGVLRPGIVHRIDKDTTGSLIVCKNDNAHKCLSDQFRAHTITRAYHAIVYNNFSEESGTIDKPIGRHPAQRKKWKVTEQNGKRAVTHYQVLDHLNKKFNYIECRLETGRTHQIRVHMAHIRHPLLGDEVYGPENAKFKHLQGQTLHARTLGFIHPTTDEYMEFKAPIPLYFQDLLKTLK